MFSTMSDFDAKRLLLRFKARSKTDTLGTLLYSQLSPPLIEKLLGILAKRAAST
ncbi:MAG TPA: hypothetical protein VNO32_53765 [Candidatus Acidoferrum sp.]|nr:hypothetical protein [Candidatus Acidoferrum sp.]